MKFVVVDDDDDDDNDENTRNTIFYTIHFVQQFTMIVFLRFQTRHIDCQQCLGM